MKKHRTDHHMGILPLMLKSVVLETVISHLRKKLIPCKHA